MRLPKATMRKAGCKMMTANIKVHLSLSNFENAVVRQADRDDPDDLADYLANLTRSKVYSLAIEMVKNHGVYWVPDSDAELDEAMIHDRVVELFPELAETK
jgi:hypothetical protein